MIFYTVDQIINYCNNDIETVATYYISAIQVNRFLLLILAAFIITTIIRIMKTNIKLDLENRMKLKQICKREDRSIKDQKKKALKDFIAAYEKEHELEWDRLHEQYK